MRRLAWLRRDSRFAQLRYLPRLIVCLFHFPPRIGLPTTAELPVVAAPRQMRDARTRTRPGQL